MCTFSRYPPAKRPADKGLALAGMVGICRIHVIHAVIDGVPEHLRCEGLVDVSVRRHRQAHAAEAEDGEVFLVQFPVEHGCSPLGLGRGAMGDKGDGGVGGWGIGSPGNITLWRGLCRGRGFCTRECALGFVREKEVEGKYDVLKVYYFVSV